MKWGLRYLYHTMLSNSYITLQNYSYPDRKLQKNQNGTRQVVLNLILDKNYILTGYVGEIKVTNYE